MLDIDFSLSQSENVVMAKFSYSRFLARSSCDFDFIWFFNRNIWIFLQHDDFNINKGTNTVGMARKPLARRHPHSDATEKMLRKNARHIDRQNSNEHCETEATLKRRKHRQLPDQ
jgi:hypothetical protein